MKRVFKTRSFARWQHKTELTDWALCKAVGEMERGLIDADLGGAVLKKRVPLPNQGKSGSTRTLVATNKGNRWFFIYGFEKNERSNITAEELETLQTLAGDLLARTEDDLDKATLDGFLKEICHAH